MASSRKGIAIESTNTHDRELSDAKKFIKKYCRVLGSGVSFSREDGCFHSCVEIESKQDNDRNVDWWQHNDHFGIHLSVEKAVDVIDGRITLLLDLETFTSLMIEGISEMRDTFSFMSECIDHMIQNLHINEDECVSLMTELFMDRVKSLTEKSFPVAQRAYDKWVEKGSVVRYEKERIASKFGQDFIKELTDGVLSFHDVYIENETQCQYSIMKMQESRSRFHHHTDEEMRETAMRYAHEMWQPWSKGEIYGILKILLGYDVGTCQRYEMDFDVAKMKVEGNIYGDSGKRLNFRTIFAGGYNIQQLHMRTIAHVFDN